MAPPRVSHANTSDTDITIFTTFCCIFFHFSHIIRSWWVHPDSISHILHGCCTGTGAIVWLPRCQWSNREEGDYSGITTTMHGKVRTMCIYFWIYDPRNTFHPLLISICTAAWFTARSRPLITYYPWLGGDSQEPPLDDRYNYLCYDRSHSIACQPQD